MRVEPGGDAHAESTALKHPAAGELERDNNMKTRLVLAFAVIGLAVASAKTYTVNLYSAVKVGSMELQPGAYTLEVKDSKAVIRNGKLHGEADVKVESGDAKYGATTVRMAGAEGNRTIEEIRLGGTKTKLVFTN